MKFSTLCKTEKFIAAFTSFRQSLASYIQTKCSLPVAFKVHFDINNISKRGLPKWPISVTFLHQKHVGISFIPDTCHMARPPQYPALEHRNNIQ
jgi:hypothetical protein